MRVRPLGEQSEHTECLTRMWILPTQLHTLATAQDTAALTLDLNEQSQACTQSFLVRSKPLPLPTWLRRLKQANWMLRLSGRILKLSHSQSFTDLWTSTLRASPASHSQPQVSAEPTKTPAISFLTSSADSNSCSPGSSFSKTSKDLSAPSSPETDGTIPLEPPFCSMSSENWKEWVIGQRQEYSLRAKSALRTSASASLLWPSARASDGEKGGPNQSGSKGDLMLPSAVNQWKTPHGFMGQGEKGKYGGGGEFAKQVREVELKNWPTTARDHKDGTAQSCRNVPANGLLGRVIHQHPSGRPDPAKLSTDGSRPELWATPEGMGGGKTSRGGDRKHELLLSGQVRKSWATATTGAGTQGRDGGMNLQTAIKQWATPSASIPQDGESQETFLAHQAQLKLTKQNGNGCGTPLTIMAGGSKTGKLNPRWVETLMGLPVGWTMPSCANPMTAGSMNYVSLETESCPPPSKAPSVFSQAA